MSNTPRPSANTAAFETSPARDTGPWTRTATNSPLGLDQERLWVTEQVHSAGNTYNISFGLHIRGSFEINLFKSAIAEVVARHEILRSCVSADQNGQPRALIASDAEIPIRYADLADLEEAERAERLRSEIDRSVYQPFNLGHVPAMRIFVARDGPDSYYVIETAHHSITDRWSYVRFNQEVFGFYRQAAFGVPYEPPNLPLQFFDFAVRQRNWLEENRGGIRRFWESYLDGAPTRETLPYDFPQSSTDRRGAHCNFVVDDDIAGRLIRYAKANRMTLNSALIGAYAALLYERTGNRDIVIGLPSVLRRDRDVGDVIGFLLTNIPIRIKVPENPTLASVIRLVRDATADVAEFANTPYSEIIAAIAPKRRLDEYPLIQTMASSLEFEEELFEFEGGEISIVDVLDGVSPNDITLGFWKSGERFGDGYEYEGIHGRFEYRSALFHPATIETMAKRLLALLSDVADNKADNPLEAVNECPAQRPPEVQDRNRSEDSVEGKNASVAMDVSGVDDETDALLQAWKSVLETEDIRASDDFFEVGGNSLLAVRLSKALRETGRTLSVRQVFADSTFAGMLANLGTAGNVKASAARRAIAPASPEQLRFLQSDLQRPELWAHSIVLESGDAVRPEQLREAFAAVVAAHRSLSSKIERDGETWRMMEGPEPSWTTAECAWSDEEAVKRHLGVIELGGPLVCATWLDKPSPRLVLTASHLVMDGWSWRILVEDLSAAYRGDEIAAEAFDYLDYSSALAELSFEEEEPFWLDQVANIPSLVSDRRSPDRHADEQERTQVVPASVEILNDAAVAVTAVGSAVSRFLQPVVVELVAMGREPLANLGGWDGARAIGNYACLYPLKLPVKGGSLEQDIRSVRETLAAVPLGGKGFGVLRSRGRVTMEVVPSVSINYVGRLAELGSEATSLFTRRRDLNPAFGSDVIRGHVLSVDVGVGSNGIELRWRTNPKILADERFEAIAAASAHNLAALTERPETRTRGGRVSLPPDAVNSHFAMLGARGLAARARAKIQSQ